MRPGQTAPECPIIVAQPQIRSFGFNEAGADCPGMPIKQIKDLIGDAVLQ